ncbi:MAG: FAD-binding protein, partial [Acidobacteria bacterium]
AELVRALSEAVARTPSVQPWEGVFASDLVLAEDGRVAGVLARHRDGRVVFHAAGAVVLATGGCGQLYARTTNPPEATGDGLALAGRAGAQLADLEFIQFHPTALDAGGDPLPLLTEALRGEGAILIDDRGRRFMPAIDRRAELAPRDVVARAIWRLQQQGRRVFLDATAAVGEAFPRRFPTVWAHCRERGLDPRREPLPVTPAAHYAMAGVAVDIEGRTTLPGLWACGEVTASGVHGANRLASNSLLEALIYGARVAASVAASMPAPGSGRGALVCREAAGDGSASAADRQELRWLMWRRVGLERDAEGLDQALTALARLRRRVGDAPGELANLVTVGRMVAAAARAREESRGAHFRRDFPAPRAELAQRNFWIYDPSAGHLPLRAVEVAAQERKIA